MNELFKRFVTAILLAATFWFAYTQLPSYFLSAGFMVILGIILINEWPRLAYKTPWLWILTPFYPVLPFAVLVFLNESSFRWGLILLFLIVCSHDIGAYLVGKKWGKHKILPSVSAGKTWEGFLGGLIISTVVTFSLVYSYSVLPAWQVLLFTVCMNGAAVIGDLWESFLKRRAGLKDSGTFLPGHGGLLDRFDSIMFGL
jgi:phosphatidate cytidylyltransferase